MKNEKINIRQLLEKYFEGQTSLDEECLLRKYFMQDDIPESLQIYKPMFAFFNEERGEEELPKKNRSSVRMWLRIAGMSAAASIVLFFSVRFFSHKDVDIHSESIVYIDGKKYTDIKTIRSQTLNTLEIFSSTDDDVISSQIEMLESFNDF